MTIKNTMDKACPNLLFDGIITTSNELVETPEGWKGLDLYLLHWCLCIALYMAQYMLIKIIFLS